ncbi:MAG TPA: hypothetical protein VGN57_13260 [Pirellulaceae bacterium]|nr:hypothetical protein [Pirellulaceae bacterium]
MRSTLRHLLAGACCLGLGLAVSSAAAQTRAPDAGAPDGLNMTIPGALDIVAVAPVQARANSGIEYRVVVRNVSENLMLHDIVLAEAESTTTSIESVRQVSKGAPAGESDQWTIKQLAPGESATLVVNASASQEGRAMTCLLVESYKPALCLLTEIVKPEIQITKSAPEMVSLCEPFAMEYTITNPGSGDIDAFVLRDPLPEGLRLIDGSAEVSYRIDGLAAGDTRNFVARVMAEKPGVYRSRAEAVAGENLRARSSEVGTRVVAADVVVEIDGPTQTYVNRNMQYTAFVHNAGQDPALATELMIHLPQGLRLIDVGQVRRSDRSFQTGVQGEPTVAISFEADEPLVGAPATPVAPAEPEVDLVMAPMEALDFGVLAPGETRQIGFVARAAEPGTFPVHAAATFVCGELEEDLTMAIAQTQVEVLSLAALAIGVADEQDPVAVGKQVSYLIAVENEGTAVDQNVRVTAQLPTNLEFVEGGGASDVTGEGRNLTFGPVESLAPGAKAEWRVLVQAKQAGNVRFEISVDSDKSATNVSAAEPTTLFQER